MATPWYIRTVYMRLLVSRICQLLQNIKQKDLGAMV